MIQGTISEKTAKVVIGIGGQPMRQVEAVLDTGFTGCLRVPQGFLAEHGLEPAGVAPCMMANNSIVDCLVAIGQVAWFGSNVEVELIENGSEVLVGMGLLEGTVISLDSPIVTVARVVGRAV